MGNGRGAISVGCEESKRHGLNRKGKMLPNVLK